MYKHTRFDRLSWSDTSYNLREIRVPAETGVFERRPVNPDAQNGLKCKKNVRIELLSDEGSTTSRQERCWEACDRIRHMRCNYTLARDPGVADRGVEEDIMGVTRTVEYVCQRASRVWQNGRTLAILQKDWCQRQT